MRIRILMLGKNKGRFINEGVADFLKKLRPFCELELIFIKDEKVHGDVPKLLNDEAKRILKHLNPDEFLIVLDEKGKSFRTVELSNVFLKLQDSGRAHFTFLIGSAHGLSIDIKEQADLLLSLSPLTMNHQIVRLVLLEQLYRIFTIQRGIAYHK